MTAAELQQEALLKAKGGQSMTNYPAIFKGFMERGIPESEIEPRVNVFTYRAWQAQGRQVRKGEKGVKVITYRELPEKRNGNDGIVKAGGRMPWSSTVFHISQTDPINAKWGAPDPNPGVMSLTDLLVSRGL